MMSKLREISHIRLDCLLIQQPKSFRWTFLEPEAEDLSIDVHFV